MPSTTPELPPSRTPALFWGLVAVSIALALVPTVWSSLDFAFARMFLESATLHEAQSWWWVQLINDYVPAVFRVVMAIALAGWLWSVLRPSARRWVRPLAFVVLAGALGPGLVVNLGFKDHWQRARPYQVLEFGGTQQFSRATLFSDQCTNNCSFVSGHVACGVFLASLMLVHRRRKVAWLVTGVAAGWVIGFARMADHAHWFSDVLWAFPITLLTSWLVWKLLLRALPDPGPPLENEA